MGYSVFLTVFFTLLSSKKQVLKLSKIKFAAPNVADLCGQAFRGDAHPALHHMDVDYGVGRSREEQDPARHEQPLLHLVNELCREAASAPQLSQRGFRQSRPGDVFSRLSMFCLDQLQKQHRALARRRLIGMPWNFLFRNLRFRNFLTRNFLFRNFLFRILLLSGH